MKKSILPLLILLSLLFSCSSEPNDLDRSGLKGKVKYIKEMQHEATHEDGAWVAGKPTMYGGRITNYDPNGLIVESFLITSDGDTTGISSCKRENGEMVEELYQSTYTNNRSRTIFERVSSEQVNFEVSQNGQRVYEGANYLDGKGRILRQVQVGGEREVTIYYVYEKNMLIENYREEVTGERTATQLYEYASFDDEGNWTSRLIYMGEDKITPALVVKREYTYYD